MSKPVLGLILGAVLGIFDGLASYLYPEVTADMLPSIVVFSSMKSLVAGVIIGFFARKVTSLPKGLLFGAVVGLAFAFAVAAMPDESGQHYYFEIMLPGALIGLILGWATQTYGGATAAS